MANEELMTSLAQMFANALRCSIETVTVGHSDAIRTATAHQAKPPSFSISEYRSSENTSVSDYFKRFEWALQLSNIPASQYAHYALVHMGTELNNAIKFLVSPRGPEDLTYDELRTTLVGHFDQAKDKYVESIEFREIVQQNGEPVSSFALRLRQGAAHCEYGDFLDRMLIEQLLHGLESRDMCDEIIAKKPATFKNNQKQQWSDQQSSEQRICGGCGGNHNRSQCKFRDAKCFNCERKGHISKVCKSSTQNPQDRSSAQIHSEAVLASPVDVIQPLSKIHSINTCGKQVIHVTIDGHSMDMEVDTGAPCGIISEKNSFYTGHRIRCLGRLPVNVSIGSTTRKLINLYVVAEDYDTLFGREWISQFATEVNLNELFTQSNTVHSLASTSSKISMDQQQALSQLLANYDYVFGDTAGTLKGPPASVHLKPGTTPVFAKARDVPLALKSKYAQEIDKKFAAGFYERVDYSEWASTTHIVVKKNGNVRITGNYKPTVNSRMIIDEHPIPKIESIFNQMKGTSLFCHLDVTDAYSHLQIDAEFRHVLTLNTPTHGLIRPSRAVYGAANILAIW
ncbi:uncharacterized protein K02A2.6-like [Topomyia yanbarensis]|uniref:uncharacterized protein K02A2.6-like n=1 Tax=Topomyia yanbarensis TaxID=2498891 RepID=UPI00273C4734|nr:uncharacterized protein K02A2.6-like [Topomyia yanbarensis]